MAEQLFIDQTTLSMYECGNRDIPVSILMELSTTYGVSVDYLLYKSDFAVLDDELCPHPDKGAYRQSERSAGD